MKTASPPVARRVRWTVGEYFRMAEAGMFGGRRVELIDGEIIELPAQGHPHRVCITKTSQILLGAFSPANWVVLQGTLKLPKYGAPDPDFHVLNVPVGTPDRLLPIPYLVIEVSDSTYRQDISRKLIMYARAGIPDYWVINIPQDRLEVYRQPENTTGRRYGWRYAGATFHGRGQQVSPLLRPQVAFPVDGLLP